MAQQEEGALEEGALELDTLVLAPRPPVDDTVSDTDTDNDNEYVYDDNMVEQPEDYEDYLVHVAQEAVLEAEHEGRENTALSRFRETLALEKEAFIQNLPYSIDARQLVDFIEGKLGGLHPGDHVVRAEMHLDKATRMRTGKALVLFRNQSIFDLFQTRASLFSIGGRPMKVTEGNGNSKRNREMSSVALIFKVAKYQIGFLPVTPSLPVQLPSSFVLATQFAEDSVSTLEIDANKAMIRVKFTLGEKDYRADYSFRNVRTLRLELDESSRVVVTFRMQECPRLFVKQETGTSDLHSFLEMLLSPTKVKQTSDLWEVGIPVQEDGASSEEWVRTIDPTDCEAFKTLLHVRIFLDVCKTDVKVLQLVKVLESFNLLSGSRDLRFNPVCAEVLQSRCNRAGGTSFYYNRFELDALEALRVLPFATAYMIHSLIGTNKLDLVHMSEEKLAHLVETLARLSHQQAGLIKVLRSFFLDRRLFFISDLCELLRQEVVEMSEGPPIPSDIPESNLIPIRQVYVTPLRVCPQPETLEPSNRVLRKFSQFRDRFIRVRFVEENFSSVLTCARSVEILERRIRALVLFGINVAGHKFKFLAFSNASVREQGCWFYDEDDRPTCVNAPTAQMVRESVGNLASIKSIGKYAARLGQGFSSTVSVDTLQVSQFAIAEDVTRNGFCFSDGVGTIAQSYANEVSRKLKLDVTPSALQVRFGGGKGVLTVMPDEFVHAMKVTTSDGSVAVHEIVFRRSMMKFDSEYTELEINDWSRMKSFYLNRQLIAILVSRGVADGCFLELLKEMLSTLDDSLHETETAMRLMIQHTDAGCKRTNVSTFSTPAAVLNLLRTGVSINKCPFISGFLRSLRGSLIYELYRKARILLPKATLLIGVMDETGTLEEGEVFVQYSYEAGDVHFPPAGKVLVGRSPSLHCGDVRTLRLRYIEALSHLVDVVVFPSQGSRPHANEMSGGDLDGDIFFVIWDERLFPPRDVNPMDFAANSPSPTVKAVKPMHIGNFFVDYIKNDHLGVIANAHLALADQEEDGVASDLCVELARQHSIAVDFVKSGVPAEFPGREVWSKIPTYPHYMVDSVRLERHSSHVLGQIHDKVEPIQTAAVTAENARDESVAAGNRQLSGHATSFEFDRDFIEKGQQNYRYEARRSLYSYNSRLLNVMRHYDITDEMQALCGVVPRHKRHRRGHEEQERLLDQVKAIKAKFWDEFWNEFSGMEDKGLSREMIAQKIKQKASAWYCVTYEQLSDRAEQKYVPLFSFPWIVHTVLCEIKASKANRAKPAVNGEGKR